MTMRKTCFVIAMTVLPMIAMAQENAENKKLNATFGEEVSRIWDNTNRFVKKTGTAIGDEFSFRGGELKVNGTYYMPLYDTNLYNGKDAVTIRDTCRQMFNNRYPQALIQTCVIPQQDWISEEVKKDGSVVGYIQTMLCHVIAKDGEEGYVNARFVFQTYRQVGHQLEIISEKWPLWERTDVIPTKDYKKLLKRMK